MATYENYNSSPENQPLNPTPGLGGNRPLFTYEELAMATNGFSAQNMLGEGGFGCVFKGQLENGQVKQNCSKFLVAISIDVFFFLCKYNFFFVLLPGGCNKEA